MSLKVSKTAQTQAEVADEQEDEVRTCIWCGSAMFNLVGECDCDGAVRAAKMERSRHLAKRQIYVLFKNDFKRYGFDVETPDGAVFILERAVDAVADMSITSAVIAITPNSQAKIGTDAKGLIKVERVDKKAYALTEED